jgi:hypothetical protein
MRNVDPTAKRSKLSTLPVDEIKIPRFEDGGYQRELSDPKVKRIVARFSELKLGVIEVAEIDGVYWVWDGQHRLVACRRMGRETIPCRISYGYTTEELADAFGDQGPDRAAVPAKDLFRSKLVAKSAAHLAAVEMIEHEGYRLEMSRTGKDAVKLNCHGAIKAIIVKDAGLSVFGTALRVFRQGWPRATTFQGTTLTGMALFIERYRDKAISPAGKTGHFESRLISVLAEHPEKDLIGQGRAETVGVAANRTTQIVVALKVLYNRGLLGRFKLPDR